MTLQDSNYYWYNEQEIWSGKKVTLIFEFPMGKIVW